MSDQPEGSPLYPDWVKRDPVAALELLRGIHQKLKNGDDLEQQDREYLRDAIGNILEQVDKNESLRQRGTEDKYIKDIRADTAFYFAKGQGRPDETYSERNRRIWWYVRRLIERGESANAAYIDAAHKFFPTVEADSSKTVEKIVTPINVRIEKGGLAPSDPDAPTVNNSPEYLESKKPRNYKVNDAGQIVPGDDDAPRK